MVLSISVRGKGLGCQTGRDFKSNLNKSTVLYLKYFALFICLFDSLFFHSLQAAFYAIFLLFLSYSLLHASTKMDPTHYRGAADLLRGFCEIVTLVVVVFYICEEINQIRM